MACRICQTNDRESLAEKLAEEMWESHREREVMGAWQDAGPYWQTTMRQFAESTIKMLAHG